VEGAAVFAAADDARTGSWVAGEERTVVHLLGRFGVTRDGVPVDVPTSAQRLVAFVALQRNAVDRSYASRRLWLDKPEARAHANLRSALWRLRRCSVVLVEASVSALALAPGVGVDAAAPLTLARALADDSAPVDLDAVDHRMLAADLLPNWYDEAFQVERDRFRELRLRGLESLSHRLVRAGRPASALEVARTAVAADPLRESAHRAVIEVHLAEGNNGEAVRQFRRLCDILEQQFGIAPSERTRELIAADTCAVSALRSRSQSAVPTVLHRREPQGHGAREPAVRVSDRGE
jgi:DNA-binding SARP family transcriptional activator